MLQLIGGKAPDHMAYQVERHAVFLSANVKTADISKAALLATRAEADAAVAALTPTVQRRYGEGTSIEVVAGWSNSMTAHAVVALKSRIDADSSLMAARIAQRIFAPNKRPAGI